MESRLLVRKRELQFELRQGNTDARRTRLLTQQLRVLERDIAAIGFDEAEVKRNSFNHDSNVKTVGTKQFYIPPPSWTTSTDDDA